MQEDPDRSTHTRFRQHHDGVRIWGGDGILHAREDGSHYLMTNPIGDEVAVNTNPSLPPAEALWIVARDLQSKGAFAKEPRLELVILPETVRVHRVTGLPISAGDALNAMAVVEQVVGYRLA